jgi:hypothetical protein
VSQRSRIRKSLGFGYDNILQIGGVLFGDIFVF